jgi:7-cyano-7-deazaguanine reductase
MNKPYVPEHTPLGKNSAMTSVYTPSLLCAIPRANTRRELGIEEGSLPFTGVDIWNSYELSWLDLFGKPLVAMAIFKVPADSPNIIESKSLKLYLNSLNLARFHDANTLKKTLQRDLSEVAGLPVTVDVIPLDVAYHVGVSAFEGICLDDLPVKTDVYLPQAGFLKADAAGEVSEVLYSHLLRSSCPVTGQPDWGSVMVSYRGPAIDREALLKYIISYRENNEFHEQCVERMFVDILARCRPVELSVYARYLRRGGLDINPYRSNTGEEAVNLRLVRQ